MKKLQGIFILIWLLVGTWVALCETDVVATGYLPSTPQSNYFWQMLCIITSIGGTYLACRLLAFKKVKAQLTDEEQRPQALYRFNALRLGILAVAIFPSLLVYYGLLNVSALYCLLIALVGSLFCWPSNHN